MNALAGVIDNDRSVPAAGPAPRLKAARQFASRQRCLPLALSAVVLLAIGYGFSAYHHLPERCFERAVTMMDVIDGQQLASEQINYELLWLGASIKFVPHASLLRGKLLLAERRYDQAMEELMVADSHPQTRLRAQLLAGQGLFETGRFRQAGIAWTRALELDPQNIDAHRWLGIAYYELGTATTAIHYMNTVATLDPADPRPHRVIGVIWRNLDEYQHAAKAFRESLARDSTSPMSELVRMDLAQVLNHMHSHAEAVEVLKPLDATVEVQTMRSVGWYGLGEADRAAAALDEVLKKAPDFYVALMTRARIALEQSNTELAADLAERAAQIKPKNPETLTLLISTYSRQGDSDKAKECVDRLKEVTDQTNDYHDLVSAASNDPLEVDLRFRAGLMAADIGMDEAAKWWLKAVLLLQPDHAAARAALSRLTERENFSQAPADALPQPRTLSTYR